MTPTVTLADRIRAAITPAHGATLTLDALVETYAAVPARVISLVSA